MADAKEIKELLREHRELLRQELREEIEELRQDHDVAHFQIPPELQRTFSAQGLMDGSSPWRTWSRHVSEENEELHEWHRHPRRVISRSSSTSPNNRFKSKSHRPHVTRTPERQPGKLTLRVPHMPEDLIRTSRRFSQMSNPLLIQPTQPNVESTLAAWVESPTFSGFIGVMILTNSVFIGIQTDVAAADWSAVVPPFFVVSEVFFAGVFLAELMLRLWVYGRDFFTGADMAWNIFDMVLILSQAVEQGITLLLIWKTGGLQDLDLSELTDDTLVLRALRIFRLLRILRVLRIMHISGELQAIMTAVMKGLRSFVWTVIFLMLLVYAVSVFITQTVTDYKISLTRRDLLDEELGDYFGSLGGTMLALFQAVTDGQEWREMLKPLMSEISPWMALPFCVYIAFTVFALLNILTGIFVDSALQNGQEEKRRFLLQEVGQLFKEADKEQMTWPDFQNQLENPHLQQLLNSLDVDEQDAAALFHMLDASHEGRIQADEFLNGCLRLDGPAKAIDLAAFIEEQRKVNRSFVSHAKFVNVTLGWLVSTLHHFQVKSEAKPSDDGK